MAVVLLSTLLAADFESAFAEFKRYNEIVMASHEIQFEDRAFNPPVRVTLTVVDSDILYRREPNTPNAPAVSIFRSNGKWAIADLTPGTSKVVQARIPKSMAALDHDPYVHFGFQVFDEGNSRTIFDLMEKVRRREYSQPRPGVVRASFRLDTRRTIHFDLEDHPPYRFVAHELEIPADPQSPPRISYCRVAEYGEADGLWYPKRVLGGVKNGKGGSYENEFRVVSFTRSAKLDLQPLLKQLEDPDIPLVDQVKGTTRFGKDAANRTQRVAQLVQQGKKTLEERLSNTPVVTAKPGGGWYAGLYALVGVIGAASLVAAWRLRG